MKSRKQLMIATVLAAMLFWSCSNSKEQSQGISSPDGKVKITVNNHDGQIFYAVDKEETKIVLPSKLGFVLKDGRVIGKKMKITDVKKTSFNETWEQPWGEKRLIENRYEEMTISLKSNAEKIAINLIFRAYNDGIGFRYDIPSQASIDSFIIMDELTEFALADDENAWWTTAYKGVYYENITQHTPVSQMNDTVSLPLTLETQSNKYLAIHEANLTNYAAMNLYASHGTTLKCDLTPWSTGEKVFAKTPFVSPWRMIIIADRAGDLLTSSLELNLNDPCKIEDTSWIGTGRYIGIWWGMHMEKYTWHMGPKHGATTENTMRYIDFAAQHGFSGVLVEGWNTGWENDWTKEGDKFNFTQPYPDFDIEKITSYGKQKGVKLVGHHETGGATINYEKQLDDAFAFYQKLGINCVKTGYVSPLLDGKERHSSQYGVLHFRKVIETAAKYHIMIVNHEPVMPTGLRRTYPNLMSGEGMRGQEYNAWSADGGNPSEHTTILPFTRGLAGPMDYTPGVFNFENPVKPNTKVKTTLAHQLALYVTIYAPWQMACDLPENYTGNPSLHFIEQVPVNWEQTKVLEAKIGDFLITTRKDRDSNNWYLGAITDENSRIFDIDLSFLDKDKKYRAIIYRDGPNAGWKTNPTDVNIEEKIVSSDQKLQLQLAEGGGTAIRFECL